MRILYVTAGIPVPGSVGGSTHVIEVCRGLAALGHHVLAIVGPADGVPPDLGGMSGGSVRIVNTPGSPALGLALLPLIAREAARFRPDAIMERYHNLAGAGLLYAKLRGLPSLLEINAPLYDPPGSRKDRLDRALGRSLRRWARWQARAADRLVTPLATTAGALARPGTIVELPWGANADLFDPARLDPALVAATRAELGIPAGAPVLAFSGSFRAWHGVEMLLDALETLLPARPALRAILIGDGAERPALVARVAGWGELGRRVIFTGRLPYPEVPRHLAVVDLGVAPFDPTRHAALRHFGFYWSPLKIFEYGAMGLPTVCPAIPPLDGIVRDGREGRTYPVGDRAGLAAAIGAVLDDPMGRRAMGASARRRASEEWSWAAHCRGLDRILRCLTR
jgi:glycosyltransferase involved in cell wall biosynthesis